MSEKSYDSGEHIQKFFTDDVLYLIWLIYVYTPPLEDKFFRTPEQILGVRELINRVLSYVIEYPEKTDIVALIKENELDKNSVESLTSSNLLDLLFREIERRANEMRKA